MRGTKRSPLPTPKYIVSKAVIASAATFATPMAATYEATLEAFKAFDDDGNGFIDGAELKKILGRASTGTSLTDEQCDQMIQQMLASGVDTDGDGKLSFEELAAWWTGRPSKREYNEYEKKVMAQDKDGDGFVDAEELMAILNSNNAKRPLTLEQVKALYDQLLAAIDANGDGKLSTDEVAAFFKKQVEG